MEPSSDQKSGNSDDKMATPSTQTEKVANQKFEENEKVLCYHGPLLYEAKCMKSQMKDTETQYFIHYSGWNKNWDEWVPESRVLKYNDENLKKQEELELSHKNTKKVRLTQKKKDATKGEDKPKKATQATAEETMPKQKKPKVETPPEQEEAKIPKEINANIQIPDYLKTWMARDYNLIMKKNKFFNLPAKCPIGTIFQDYCNQPISDENSPLAQKSKRQEVINGMADFFNTIFAKKLLYSIERKQCEDFMKKYPDRSPTNIFGLAYFVRFLTKLGSMIDCIKMDEEADVAVLTDQIHNLLEYICENYEFDDDDYIDANLAVMVEGE